MQIELIDIRTRYLDIFEPRVPTTGENKTPKFKFTAFEKPDGPNVAIVKAAIAAVSEAAWGINWRGLVNSFGQDKMCLRDGNLYLDKEQGNPEWAKGHMLISASNKNRPTVMDVDGVTQLVQADGRPYPGCFVNIFLDVYADKKNKGVFAMFEGCQFMRKGDAFGGGAPTPASKFKSFAAGTQASDKPPATSGLGGMF